MDDLRARLAGLGYRDGPGAEAASPRGRDPRAPSQERPRLAYPVDRVVEGSYVSTPAGDCFVAEHHHPPGHPHGVYRLEEALEADPAVFPWLGKDAALASLDLSRCVFLDLETTGLAGGTGTYAFLVGLGYFQNHRFVVRQLFMADYDGEEAMLHALAETLEPFDGVVTFNGRVFDLPLLETRFQMARRPFPLSEFLHLDLLFPARRLWRERLESCALSSLEREILGVEREEDVPGWRIPALYFEYLQKGDARPLAPVFEHNRQDLLSMATLATRLVRQYADPFQPDVEDARDLCALGTAFEGLGLLERAAQCYERAVGMGASREVDGRAMLRLGNLYKRLRLRQDAVAIWRKLAAGGHVHTTFANVELAKHYEHAARDYREAERLTLQAMSALELRAARGGGALVERERLELEYRLARLRRKLGR